MTKLVIYLLHGFYLQDLTIVWNLSTKVSLSSRDFTFVRIEKSQVNSTSEKKCFKGESRTKDAVNVKRQSENKTLRLMATQSFFPPGLFHLQLSTLLLPHQLHLSSFTLSFLSFPIVHTFTQSPYSSSSLPLETYWGDLEHEIKILASDITEYFQPQKIHSAIKIKGQLGGRLTFKTKHYSWRTKSPGILL